MALIIDFSAIAIAGAMAIQSQLTGKTEEESVGLIRHVILNSILSHKKNYGKKYGEVIIACDGKTYWRREKFPQYKASRKKAREESSFDWATVFKALHTIREELIENFPYKVLYVDRAEADDIIACLTKFFREEFGNLQEVMIISHDNDMSQLQSMNGVNQYSPITKKLIKLSKQEVKEYVNLCIVKGQKKDGIPSIKQSDDSLITEDKTRAPAISAKLLEKFLVEGISACENDFERKNYERNKLLFDFNCIPEEIYNLIIDKYTNYEIKKFDRMKLLNFLIKKQCKQLLSSVEDF